MVRFRLLGIPVGVHITFLFVALLGATAYRGWDIAWWTVAAFLSILLHEMGHALTARGFGSTGVNVTLYGLGGLTTFSPSREMGHGKSFVVSAAGSFVGIVAGGIVWALAANGVFDGANRSIEVLVNSFVFTALIWGVLNWIPIVPLDGGHMVESLASMVNEDKAPLVGQITTWVSVAILGPIAWVNGYRFAVIILGFFAFAGLRDYRMKMDARRAAERAEKEARGVTVPDEVRPAPPASPAPPPPQTQRPPRQDPPEFPI